jgi:hypothetical protein
MMQISKETLNVIKNFSAINGSLMLKAGNKLSTISEGKNVMAEVTIAETFTSDFGIYDLHEFLGVISLFDSTDLDFKEKYVLISDSTNSSSRIKYFAAGEGVVKVAPATIKFPSADVTFTLNATQLAMIQRTAGILKASDVTITGDGTNIDITVSDKKNDTANAYTYSLGATSETFQAHLKVENLKMIPNDYEVAISKKKISRFKHTASDLTYYVAVEADSEF